MHPFLKYVTHPTYDEAWHNYTLPKVTRHSLSSAAVPCPAILWGGARRAQLVKKPLWS